MTILQSIEEREHELIDFIESKIINSIKQYCQWCLHIKLKDVVREQEQEYILKFLEMDVVEELKNCCPLHFKTMKWNPLFSVINDCNCMISYEHQSMEYMQEYHRKSTYSAQITYLDFEEAGFDKVFTKRVIDKYLNIAYISRKKMMGGSYIYSLIDPDHIKNEITLEKNGITASQHEFKYLETENWIYDKFDDEYLTQEFEKIKIETFKKIETQGTL